MSGFLRLPAGLALGVALLAGCACGQGPDSARVDGKLDPPHGRRSQTLEPRSNVDARPKIVILGDSLTAGLGVPINQAYPTVLQQRITAEGLGYEVVNAGVSGDTSAGGLARLDWVLQGDVRILVVALGGNDGLRGLPSEELRRNLSQIIERAQARGIRVILAGMEAPPNYGQDYIVSFHDVYPTLAQRYHIPLVPFLLQDVAGVDQLNQPDGIHPTAKGARVVADNVWAVLKPIAEGQRREERPGS